MPLLVRGRWYYTEMHVCLGCNADGMLTSNDATDLLPLCPDCYDLFKAAGVLPFVPEAYRLVLEQWLEVLALRLCSRRMVFGWEKTG